MAILLTKRQKQVLLLMKNGEELVQSRDGKGWPQYWIGLERTTHSLWWFLVENILISTINNFNEKVVYWHINESGEKLLAGEKNIYPINNQHGEIEYKEFWR